MTKTTFTFADIQIAWASEADGFIDVSLLDDALPGGQPSTVGRVRLTATEAALVIAQLTSQLARLGMTAKPAPSTPLDLDARYRVNDVLTALSQEFGVDMEGDDLNELTHHVADAIEDAS